MATAPTKGGKCSVLRCRE